MILGAVASMFLATGIALADVHADSWLKQVGEYYDNKEYSKALDIARPVAEQGHPIAQYFLGLLHKDGTGVPKDQAKAVEWFRKSANQGYPDAQFALGIAYLKGDGVKADAAQYRSWMRQAAEKGQAVAMYHVGTHYYKGEGEPRNLDRAIYWLQRAADGGFGQAREVANLVRELRAECPSLEKAYAREIGCP